jgi:hypothetical protein
MLAPNNVREWFAFYGGEESGISLELASKIWEAATNAANKRSLPSLEEVKAHVQRKMWLHGSEPNSLNITELCYDYICRQLSAIQ